MKYGWIKDLPDHRDLVLCYSPKSLPKTISLMGNMPAIYDQGHVGSCTANAIAGAIEYAQGKEKKEEFVPSRLFVYYNERLIEGTTQFDAGAQIRDGMKALTRWGYCNEKNWPYSRLFSESPSPSVYSTAKNGTLKTYAKCQQNEPALKNVLSEGFPVIFGFSVYESFESHLTTTTGIVKMPSRDESLLGGHAVLLCGYDDETKRFLVRNSWGKNWGHEGYCLFPYEYLTDPGLASDFWVINYVPL